MKTRPAFAVAFPLILAAGHAVAQLTPPVGPVSPTMKRLDQIETRTCLNDLRGDEGAVFLITEPGNYYLDADVVGEAGKHGIRIVTQGRVSIDLNGFDVVGVPGSLDGVNMQIGQGPVDGSELHLSGLEGDESVISDWEGSGVRTGGVVVCVCHCVASSGNGGDGFAHLHAENIIHRDVAARFNGGNGFYVQHAATRSGSRKAGVTNRFRACRARSNGGSGFQIDARSDSYDVAFESGLSCGNMSSGISVREFASIPGNSKASSGTIRCWDMSCRDNAADGVRVVVPNDSKVTCSCTHLISVGNGGDGLCVLPVDPSTRHSGATGTVESCVLSSNAGNGIRTSNPLHVESTTCGENALFGVRASGDDPNESCVVFNVCHLIANGGGGALLDHGRFSGVELFVTDNNGPGIQHSDGCLLLTDSSVTNNTGAGVDVNGTFNVVSSNFRRNGGPGVKCINGKCVMESAVCEFNGNANAPGGMVFINCPEVQLMRCVSSGNVGDGVNARSSVGPIRWMSPEMLVSRNSGAGMNLSNCEGAVLERCHSSGNGTSGFLLNSSVTRARVIGCSSTSEGNGTGFVVIGTRNLIAGCSAEDTATGGFNVFQGNALARVIRANEVRNNTIPDANILY
ncbi:MAG: right-handed parallel beta-helix repeat-containing protein [Planctomycetota bacterium]